MEELYVFLGLVSVHEPAANAAAPRFASERNVVLSLKFRKIFKMSAPN
jgi:hypothetical protein